MSEMLRWLDEEYLPAHPDWVADAAAPAPQTDPATASGPGSDSGVGTETAGSSAPTPAQGAAAHVIDLRGPRTVSPVDENTPGPQRLVNDAVTGVPD